VAIAPTLSFTPPRQSIVGDASSAGRFDHYESVNCCGD
jgi:hypothetical protein